MWFTISSRVSAFHPPPPPDPNLNLLKYFTQITGEPVAQTVTNIWVSTTEGRQFFLGNFPIKDTITFYFAQHSLYLSLYIYKVYKIGENAIYYSSDHQQS